MILLCRSVTILVSILLLSSCQSAYQAKDQSKQQEICSNRIPIANGKNVCKIEVSVKKRSDFPHTNIENIWKEYLVRLGYVVVSRSEDLERIERELSTQGRRNSANSRDPSILGYISPADAILLIEATKLKTERKSGRTYIRDVAIVGRLIDVKTGNLIWIKNATYDRTSNNSALLGEIIALPFTIIGNVLFGSTAHQRTNKLWSAVENLMKSFPAAHCT